MLKFRTKSKKKTTAPTKKKRGRPKGSTNKKKTTKAASSTTDALPKKFNKTFGKVLEALEAVQEHEEGILVAKEKASDLLDTIKEGGVTSFEHDGMFYSIRSRGERTFCVSSEVPFGSWLKGKRKSKKNDDEEEED